MQKIKLQNKTIEINKMPLGKYAQVLEALEKLPQEFSEFGGITNDRLLAKLPKIIAKCLPELIKVLTIATDLTEEDIQAFGLDELADVIIAVVEENRYKEVYEKLKKKLSPAQG